MSLEHAAGNMGRRGFLRGLGVTLALPSLEAFGGTPGTASAAKGMAVTASGAPLRSAFLYVPNGVIMDQWRPKGGGKDFEFARSMKSLESMRNDLQVVKGFKHEGAKAGGDGAGDHARSSAAFLTGVRPKKTAGSDIRLGRSVDQVMAERLGHTTRFQSLELSCDGVRKSGACDSGYSCAYQFNISWRSATQPMTPEVNPRLVFERLFGGGSKKERLRNAERRKARRESVLDFVKDESASLSRRLGQDDQVKLDEYMEGVREVERRIELAESFGPLPDPGVPAPEGGIPDSYEEHIHLMFEMLVLAFKTDSTRVASFLLAHDGSNRSFREIGVSDGHHHLSHHKKDPEKMEKISRIDEFYCQQLCFFMEKLRQTPDVDGRSLLDNSMIVWGSAISDGDRHLHDDLPVILAGHGGGNWNPGRHWDLGGEVPMSNLYVHMLQAMGIQEESFGDSTGILKGA